MTERVFSNARIVLPDAVICGSLKVADGRIADISEGASSVGEDLAGDYLIPGLVELHTDHLENHYAPRPGVLWDPLSALLAHDAQIATAGITTVLDALRIGIEPGSKVSIEDMRILGDAVHRGEQEQILRAEHFLHLRCEVSSENAREGFLLFDDDPRVRLASLMDHTPGQRQFVSLEKHREFNQARTGHSDEVYFTRLEKLQASAKKWSESNRLWIAEACRQRDVRVASHDDATEDHVGEAIRDSVVIAEFPTTKEAARAAHDHGMKILMGSPNVVRGKSHSGNVSAVELAHEGTLDILSSDYVPVSLVQAVFLLSEQLEHISLPEAVGMVSKVPAEIVGLNDRGAIEVGRRADLVRIKLTDGPIPVVRAVWRAGERVS